MFPLLNLPFGEATQSISKSEKMLSHSFEMYSKHMDCIFMYIWFTRHSRFAHHWMVLSLGTAWKGRWIRVLPAPEKAPGMFPLGFEWYRNNVFDGLVLNLVSGLEHVLFFHISSNFLPIFQGRTHSMPK